MLEAKNISMSYPKSKEKVLIDVNLELKEGELIVIKGKSGSGKSTLLALLGGYLTPVSGNIYYNKKDINRLNDKEKSYFHKVNIGYLPQSNVMLKNYTVIENLIAPFIYGDPKSDENSLEDLALVLLDKLQIRKLKDRYPCELSGGELKRVALARAMMREPDILLADEPTTGLDKESAGLILQILSGYADNNKSVIISTHDETAFDFATRVIEVI